MAAVPVLDSGFRSAGEDGGPMQIEKAVECAVQVVVVAWIVSAVVYVQVDEKKTGTEKPV